MIICVCDVCRKQLGPQAQPNIPLFCDRCASYAQDFVNERAKVAVQQQEKFNHALEKFRNDYLQKILSDQRSLKAVGSED